MFAGNFITEGFSNLFNLILLVSIIMCYRRWLAKKRDQELLNSNPEAWKARKEVEEMKRQRRNGTLGKAAGFGFNLARLFLRK